MKRSNSRIGILTHLDNSVSEHSERTKSILFHPVCVNKHVYNKLCYICVPYPRGVKALFPAVILAGDAVCASARHPAVLYVGQRRFLLFSTGAKHRFPEDIQASSAHAWNGTPPQCDSKDVRQNNVLWWCCCIPAGRGRREVTSHRQPGTKNLQHSIWHVLPFLNITWKEYGSQKLNYSHFLPSAHVCYLNVSHHSVSVRSRWFLMLQSLMWTLRSEKKGNANTPRSIFMYFKPEPI